MRALILSILLLSIPANATEVKNVDSAILGILTNGIPKRAIGAYPNHPLVSNHDERSRISRAIVAAADRWKISPYLLVAIAFRESSFGQKKGRLGEESIFQIIPRVAKSLREGRLLVSEPECDLTNVEGAALCSAGLLAAYTKMCGSIEGALAMYATGKTCQWKSADRVGWIVNDRMSTAKILEKGSR